MQFGRDESENFGQVWERLMIEVFTKLPTVGPASRAADALQLLGRVGGRPSTLHCNALRTGGSDV